MTVVALLTRAGLRARWRTWLVLAVLTGLAGGLVTAVAAGARRTDAAYPALVAWSRAPDDLVSVASGSGSSVGASYSNVPAAAIARLPQVTAFGSGRHLYRARAGGRDARRPAERRDPRDVLAPEAARRTPA